MTNSQQYVNQLIKAVAKKGYITISSSERDKRAINVKVTDMGLQAVVESTEIGILFLADIFNSFSETELETLWSLLKKLHCFDGEEYSGFEEDVNYRVEADYSDLRARSLGEFKKRRNR